MDRLTGYTNKIKQILNEHGYRAGFGMPQEPEVINVDFPENSDGSITYNYNQPDPHSPTVTDGSTSLLNDPREDISIQKNEPIVKSCQSGILDSSEPISEIGSLLVTIGYILNQNRLISDKFDISQILNYLNHNFEVAQHPTDDNKSVGYSLFEEYKKMSEKDLFGKINKHLL